jgi:hypothetical protein
MTTAYVVVNGYQPFDSDGDNVEIKAITLSESKADDILTEITSNLNGYWIEGHTVFQVRNADMEYDSYYIESYEVSE